MRTDVRAGLTKAKFFVLRQLPQTLFVLTMTAGLGFSSNSQAAAADLESQLSSIGGVCGADVLGNTYAGCTAGDISISDVINVEFEGNPTSCVSGDPLTISTATILYSMKTGTRQDLVMWIGDQEYTDPRLNSDVGAGKTCSAYSLPSPFTDTPTMVNPFGDNDGDQCGDISLSVTEAERTFTNITFNCQDNDQNGFADTQILLTWDQNAQTACGTGPGESFPTVGARSKCDYTIRNTETITVIYSPILTLVKEVTNNNGGGGVPADWTLTAAGPTPGVSGVTGSDEVTGVVVSSGDYLLSESGPAGYDGTWVCNGGTLVGDTLTLEDIPGIPGDPGEAARSVTCTLTNDDQPASLTLQKFVTNNNGGMAVPTDWMLSASGPTPLSGAGGASSAAMSAGAYILNETGGSAGYTASAWSCVDDLMAPVPATPLILLNGAVVTCSITNSDVPATLTLVKEILNDNGGPITDVDTWDLTATGTGDNSTPITGASTAFWFGGVAVAADTYTLSESVVPGYAQLGQWVCTGGIQSGNQITVANGESATCLVTNDDQPATLTLIKTVSNDFGGNADVDDWTLTADGTVDYSGNTTAWAGGMAVNSGSYALTESGPSGYTAGSWSCEDALGPVASDPLVVGAGQVVSCTINNTAQAPSLTLIKDVQGGSAARGDFTLRVTGNDGAAGTCGQDGLADYVDSGAGAAVSPVESNCAYSITEDAVTGYSLTNISCVDDGSGAGVGSAPLSLNEGQSVTCTVTNTAVAAGTITVVKQVNNNNGGTLGVGDFPLQVTAVGDACNVDGSDQTSPYVISTPGPDCVYTVAETQQAGYVLDSIVCVAEGGSPTGATFTYTAGDTWECTVTNSDEPVSLTLVKNVSNNSGGEAGADEWTLLADGDNDYSGTTSEWAGGINVQAGTYTLSESNGPEGYTASAWSCELTAQPAPERIGGGKAPSKPLFDLSGDVLTLGLGEAVTCTITNDDNPATLTLIKEVITQDGGEAVSNDWTLTADGTVDYSGLAVDYWGGGVAVNAGSYLLSEDGPDGYQASDWVCVPAEALVGSTVTIGVAETVSCTITNDDIGPVLQLEKVVVNDNGGEVTEAAFELTLQGVDGTHDTAQPYGDGSLPPVKANVDYTIDETLLDGYSKESLVCLDGETEVPSAPLSLELGQSVICTITNDDIAPTLTLIKDVDNGDGGTALAADFDLTLTGDDSGFDGSPDHSSGLDYKDGDAPTIYASVNYTVSEDPVPAGYEMTGIACVDSDTQVEIQNGFTPLLAQNIECTVTNDDLPPTLTLVKEVTNDNGGSLEADSFPITLTGADGTHDSGVDYFNADSPEISGGVAYTVSEVPPGGYELVGIECRDAAGADVGSTFTAMTGDEITCTVTNDDILQNAYFAVTKDFSDDSAGEVDILITCNTGLPLTQTFTLVEGGIVNFVVDSFEPGSMDCRIEEVDVDTPYQPGYLAGATTGEAGDIRSEEEGCYFDAIVGGQFTCDITNTAEDATFTVSKVWEFTNAVGDDYPRLADVTIYCNNEMTPGNEDDGGYSYSTTLEGDDSVSVSVDTTLRSAECSAEEAIQPSGVESEDDCDERTISAGGSSSCTFTNSVFFEGIPTLSQYGLAIMALLMLGVGMVGFRRFS